MRWKELILEKKSGAGGTLENYSPMFTALAQFFPFGVLPNEIIRKIKDIRRVMKRKDRIIWMLRWYRVYLIDTMPAQHSDSDVTPEMIDKIRKKLLSEAIRSTGYTGSETNAISEAKFAMSNLSKFLHWSGVPCEALQALRFGYQIPTQLVSQLADIEKKWIESRDGYIELDPEDTELIDFGNGWAWFLLNRGSCELEADAMGHCGNVPSERSGDRIVSLRKHITGDIWSPHLTFILHRNGYLGEMKGRGNLKPTQRYHTMITALLEDPHIKGVVGGGYMPESNFAIEHLPSDEQKRLKDMKPGFETFNNLIKQGRVKEAKEMIMTKIGDRADEIRGFLEDRPDMAIIEEYHSVDSFINDKAYDYGRLFDQEIANRFENNIIMSKAGKEIDGDHIYNKFYDDYYYSTFEQNWYYIIEYSISEIEVVFSDKTNGPVKVCLSIQEIEHQSDENNDERSISKNEPLDSVREYGYNSWSDISGGDFGDDIEEQIVHCYVESNKRQTEELNVLENMIISRYVEDDTENGYSKTQPHPDQHEFDLGDGYRRVHR